MPRVRYLSRGALSGPLFEAGKVVGHGDEGEALEFRPAEDERIVNQATRLNDQRHMMWSVKNRQGISEMAAAHWTSTLAIASSRCRSRIVICPRSTWIAPR